MTMEQFNKDTALERFQEVFAKKGYAFFNSKKDYDLNIIGVRSDFGDKVTNKFDDLMFVIYWVNGELNMKTYDITTEPGMYYMTKKLGNSKGTAILVPGQYRGCWMIGKHNGKYEALVQCRPVKVYRDGDFDMVYDKLPGSIDTGLFGLNIHRSNPVTHSITVDNWSAGCQVFAKASDFKEFMALCNEQKKRYGNGFTYTLLDEKDVLPIG